ncbi:MAG TPA: PH domain-containing protein [Streptosporangiaceae bacterium]|nr:PH domain-containing protein [Streptosporangiaceae bacterium]
MQGQGPPSPNGEARMPRSGQATAPSAAPGADAGRPAPGGTPPAAAAAGSSAPLLTEEKVFRLPGSVVAWWAWTIFAVIVLADIVFTGRNHTGAEIVSTLALVTGVVYACALRPRVVADADAVAVRNPLRDHRIPWGSVAAIDLRESVQVHCLAEPGAKRGKVIHSWALYAQRRSMLRAELRSRGDRRRLPRSPYELSDRAPTEAQQISRQPAAQIMAKQLDELATQARNRGAAPGPRVVTWAWRPAVAMAVPAVAVLLVFTVLH